MKTYVVKIEYRTGEKRQVIVKALTPLLAMVQATDSIKHYIDRVRKVSAELVDERLD